MGKTGFSAGCSKVTSSVPLFAVLLWCCSTTVLGYRHPYFCGTSLGGVTPWYSYDGPKARAAGDRAMSPSTVVAAVAARVRPKKRRRVRCTAALSPRLRICRTRPE